MNVPSATGRDAEQILLYGKCLFQFGMPLNTFTHLGSLQTHCAFSRLDGAGIMEAGSGEQGVGGGERGDVAQGSDASFD